MIIRSGREAVPRLLVYHPGARKICWNRLLLPKPERSSASNASCAILTGKCSMALLYGVPKIVFSARVAETIGCRCAY